MKEGIGKAVPVPIFCSGKLTEMKRFTIAGWLLACLLTFRATAQNRTTSQTNQVWLAYFNQSRWSERWGTWTDIHLRTKEKFFTNFSQAIFRVGLTYYLNDQAKFTLGYSYINHFPAEGHTQVSQPEHRPWQQFQWHTKYKHIRLMQWFRFEERYRRKIKDESTLAEGYQFNFRIRYNFFSQIPLSKRNYYPNTLSLVINNEVHLNFGKEIVYNTFDQNRFFLGFAYHLNSHDNIQFGYMNLYQQLAAGNRYRSLHVARIFFFQNLDFRKKKPAQ